MAEIDERELVSRCRAGDEAAFGELVDRYKNLVYAMVYRMVNDRTQADDLAQEVFLRSTAACHTSAERLAWPPGFTGSWPTSACRRGRSGVR
jgi:DNA-directed RNA polymerase specialized sigma24 family protein